jgi:sugar (pentulose or hexulose) kinase
MSTHTVIAVDLGAESGRVMEINFDGERLTQHEHHRFPNIPVQVHHTLYWDVLRLWHEIQTGIAKGADHAASIGVDSWGVDFALLDRDGSLLANPVHYRDARTDGMMDWVFGGASHAGPSSEQTGIQFMQLNTLYQIASLVKNQSPLLDTADTYLTLPDLFNYWLWRAHLRADACQYDATSQSPPGRLGSWDTGDDWRSHPHFPGDRAARRAWATTAGFP